MMNLSRFVTKGEGEHEFVTTNVVVSANECFGHSLHTKRAHMATKQSAISSHVPDHFCRVRVTSPSNLTRLRII